MLARQSAPPVECTKVIKINIAVVIEIGGHTRRGDDSSRAAHTAWKQGEVNQVNVTIIVDVRIDGHEQERPGLAGRVGMHRHSGETAIGRSAQPCDRAV